MTVNCISEYVTSNSTHYNYMENIYINILIYYWLFFKECDNHTFGGNCNFTCGNCANKERCNHVDGNCPNGCDPGSFGRLCDKGKVNFSNVKVLNVHTYIVLKQTCQLISIYSLVKYSLISKNRLNDLIM